MKFMAGFITGMAIAIVTHNSPEQVWLNLTGWLRLVF
jgi:hypothetical protein